LVAAAEYVPDQGHIVNLSLDPQAGHEQAGRRPVLILSVKRYNKVSSLCLICPITNQAKGYPFEIELPKGLKTTGVLMSDQIKSLDWRARQAEFVDDIPLSIVEDVIKRVNLLFS